MARGESEIGVAEPLRLEAIRSMLAPQRLGKTIRYFQEVDSTNVCAARRAREGAPEGEVVIAETQSQGKGRLGRHWFSPPYMNLYMSVILRPTLPPADAPQLTLASAVALAETVEPFLRLPPEIKWPNDILVAGKKLAGVLTESSCEGGRVLFAIVGIGVNLNLPREAMPEAIRERATSLMIATGRCVDRSAFVGQLIHNLDRCYGELRDSGFSCVARRWETYFRLKGKKVRVESPGHAVSGKAMGIDGEGALLLEGEGGEIRRVFAGDVLPLEA